MPARLPNTNLVWQRLAYLWPAVYESLGWLFVFVRILLQALIISGFGTMPTSSESANVYPDRCHWLSGWLSMMISTTIK
jgi:hypothetical protein